MTKQPTESVESMMKRFEYSSRDVLSLLYFDMDSLYIELSYLNRSLNNFMAGKMNDEITSYEKKIAMDEIRERIPAVYDEINHVKLCIQAEKFNMNRLRNRFGNVTIKYKPKYLNLDKYYKNQECNEDQPYLIQTIYKSPESANEYNYDDSREIEKWYSSKYYDVDSDSDYDPYERDDENYRDEYRFNPLLGTVEQK